jgi:ferredoxin-type protein NapH
MSLLSRSLGQLFGRKPLKPNPSDFSEEAFRIHEEHRQKRTKTELLAIHEAREAQAKNTFWRRRRWGVLISVNLFFVASSVLHINALEGALTGSRFVGFHMADLNSALQVMLAFKQVLINLLIGTVTIAFIWWLLGGRTFCAWVCPYHLLAEWAELLHLRLKAKGWAMDVKFERGTRTWLWLIFAVLAFVSSYTVYETISPTGILSRALIYGPGLALVWVALILLFEIFFSRRAWCRYACPIGLTYGLVGATSPLKVQYHLNDCFHDGACRQVCLVPHALEMTKPRRATAAHVDIGADCTRCGRCVKVCPTQSLTFEFKGLSKTK